MKMSHTIPAAKMLGHYFILRYSISNKNQRLSMSCFTNTSCAQKSIFNGLFSTFHKLKFYRFVINWLPPSLHPIKDPPLVSTQTQESTSTSALLRKPVKSLKKAKLFQWFISKHQYTCIFWIYFPCTDTKVSYKIVTLSPSQGSLHWQIVWHHQW